MKEFEMSHRFITCKVEKFTEESAPHWLKFGGVEGSTICNRWFWNDYIMKLEVGETIDTDFRTIKRMK